MLTSMGGGQCMKSLLHPMQRNDKSIIDLKSEESVKKDIPCGQTNEDIKNAPEKENKKGN